MDQRKQEIRSVLISEMCEVGDLIRKGDDLYEDMGGHIVHESNLDDYISDFMKNLTEDERRDLIERTVKICRI